MICISQHPNTVTLSKLPAYMYNPRLLILSICTITACGNTPEPVALANKTMPPLVVADSLPPAKTKPVIKPDSKDKLSKKQSDDVEEAPAPTPQTRLAPSGAAEPFVELITLAPSIRVDIRYATADNFTKAKIYDCGRCYLRPEAAAAIAQAQDNLKKEGLGLKMYDCYRPSPYQQRLWDKVPDPNYVTPPAKGSMHSRGAAVDLTLVDLATGKTLDMGTPYDFFGPEAHTDYTNHSKTVLDNRAKLRRTLEAVGFQGIRTEWWHFSYRAQTYPLSDWVWPCK